MKKRIIIGISLGLVGIGIVILGFILIKKDNNPEIIDSPEVVITPLEDIYQVNIEYDEEENVKDIYTDYDDFSKIIKTESIKEEDFINNNIYVFKVPYDTCGERDFVPTDKKIEKNKIIVTVSYRASCGVCAPDNIYFAMKVSKEESEKEVEIKYNQINKLSCDPNMDYKPIIYIYPTDEMEVEVKLLKEENLTVTYPKYQNSWKVLANPDGTLRINDREYYSLFWEGKNHNVSMKKDGFVVKRENTESFLEEKLEILGLNQREANEFIIFWLSKLSESPYNYIRFETLEEINEYMPISITPVPDTLIRIQMDYKPLNEKIEVEEQMLEKKERNGYQVIEWGGSIIN